jgi:hypothetical protein
MAHPQGGQSPLPKSEPAAELATPTGYALVAQRITRWTSNLLATAIILITSLVLGRTVMDWWYEDPSAPASSSPREFPAAPLVGNGLRTLEFGDAAHVIHSRALRGTREQAIAGLRQSCLEVGMASPAPPGSAGPGESQFLTATATARPVLAEGDGRLYELDDEFSMAVLIRVFPVGSASGGVAAKEPRVAAWGFVLPADERSWNLYIFQTAPGGSFGESASPASAEVPIPPGSRRVMGLRQQGGGRMLAFRGFADEETWVDFYRDWFRDHGGRPLVDWRHNGVVWHARYALAGPRGETPVDVHFGADQRGTISGIIISGP